MNPRIAITIGDKNGIGPEVVLKSLSHPNLPKDANYCVISPAEIIKAWGNRLGIDAFSIPVVKFDKISEYPQSFVEPPFAGNDRTLEPGAATRESGELAAASIEYAAKLAMDGRVDAIVTAPISKLALRMAGFQFPGHTEFLAHLSGDSTPVMLLIAGEFRVAVATTHLALKDVPQALTQERLLKVACVLDDELKTRFGISEPKIALTGLNPHAGESGEFGREEIEVISPAIEKLRKEGVRAEGPFPADALFSRIRTVQKYDAYLTMYHDQGLIPVKMLAAGKGVNYTCGLPFVRTSPDHGTAFEIAGKNVASPESMLEAIRLAVATVRRSRVGS